MTSRVVARGCEWCSSCLHDGWGDGLTDEQIKALADLVVGHFEAWTKEEGQPCYWYPSTSEVISDAEFIDLNLDNVRELAQQDVWESLVDDKGPLTDEVAAILHAATKVKLLVLYPVAVSQAWPLLGDDALLFGDNGGDPDGAGFYQLVSALDEDHVDAIIGAGLGHVESGWKELYYTGSDEERERMDRHAPDRWCGYHSGDLFYLAQDPAPWGAE